MRTRHYKNRKFSPDEAVGRALRKVGERDYGLFGNNCEHFAAWCVQGDHRSRQIDRTFPFATGAQGAMVAAGSTMTVSSAGTVAGLSGPGVMSGLAATGPAGAVGGLATLAGSGGIGAAFVMNNTVLKDSASLPREERRARRFGRSATFGGTAVATVGGIAAVSGSGTVAGLSGAGIMSGLAALGSITGGGAVAGVGIVVAAPAIAAVTAGWLTYKIAKKVQSGIEAGEAISEPDPLLRSSVTVAG